MFWSNWNQEYSMLIGHPVIHLLNSSTYGEMVFLLNDAMLINSWKIRMWCSFELTSEPGEKKRPHFWIFSWSNPAVYRSSSGMAVSMTAGKQITVVLWKLKTLLAVSQWPTCSGSPRQKHLSYSCLPLWCRETWTWRVCKAAGIWKNKTHRTSNEYLLPCLIYLSVLTGIGYFSGTMLILTNTEVDLLLVTLSRKVFDACNFMNTGFLRIYNYERFF